MLTVITPVLPTENGKYQAKGEVARVFDTNDLGDMLPVRFERIDGRTFSLPNHPFGQVYAEVVTSAYSCGPLPVHL